MYFWNIFYFLEHIVLRQKLLIQYPTAFNSVCLVKCPQHTLTVCSWESEPQVLHLNKGWLFSIWFPNIQIGIFSLHEQELVPLMLPYVLHGGEKEIEFHQMLYLVSNTFLLGKIELFLKHCRILPQKCHCCRPTVLPLCVPPGSNSGPKWFQSMVQLGNQQNTQNPNVSLEQNDEV